MVAVRRPVVQGNEPYYVNDAGDSRSLWIAAGGTVTTPSVCVGIDRPTIRFFVRRSGSPLSSLTVEVLFEDAGGNVQSLPIGALAATNAWDPSAPLAVVANLLPLLPESRTAVAFRFSAGAGADFFVDDVYVDPYRK